MPASAIPALRNRLRRLQGQYPEFIRRSGISRSWVSKFANGKLGKRPGFELMNRLLTTLDAMERESAGGRRHRERVRAGKGRTAGKPARRKR